MRPRKDGLMTVGKFLSHYSVSRSGFYRMLKEKDCRLRIIKIGRASRIAVADAEAWAESLPTFGGEVRP